MEIMASRYISLQQTMEAYRKTGVSLIEIKNGNYTVAAVGDDLGASYIIPKLSLFLNLPVETSYYYFFLAVILIANAVGLIGFFLIYKRWLSRLIILIAIYLLTLITFRQDALYTVFTSTAIGIVPLFLYFAKRNTLDYKFYFFLFTSGVLITFSHYIRAYSSFGVLLFMLIIISMHLKVSRTNKSYLISTIILGILIPALTFNSVITKRDHFLKSNDPQMAQPINAHVFWHNVYIGLGFLNFSNGFKINYQDLDAINKVKRLYPDVNLYLHPNQYEKILKNEVLRLLRTKPTMALMTVFAKFGVIIFFIVLYANIGLICAWFLPKDKTYEFAFWVGILFNSSFGIIVYPMESYLLGLFAMATLYGIVSINEVFERNSLHPSLNN